MGDNKLAHTDLTRLARKGYALLRRGVACGKDDAGLGTYLHHTHHLGQHPAAVVDHGNAARCPAFTPAVVSGIERGHPDAPAQAAAGLHRLLGRKHVDLVAMHPVHAHTPEALGPRQGLPDDVGPVVAAEIV